MSATAESARTIGRYRVIASLGSGAMGEVVRARDERLGRDVAIKRVRNVFGAMTSLFHARFEAEARALAALAHPGVVQVFDLGIDGDAPYLVMELIEGPSLRSLLDRDGPLAPAAVRGLGIQLARALEAAHARGILHRDIKPANVLQAPGGAWKLADFGVARVPESDMTMTGQFIGTPAYAAPEALALGQYSPASDVFGLATTLVEAVTGAKPRRDATLAEMIARASEPVALRGVAPELAAALAPALAIDPRNRPSAAALADLLASGTTGAHARPVVIAGGGASAAESTQLVPDATAAGATGTQFVPDATSPGASATQHVPDGTYGAPARPVGDFPVARASVRRGPLVRYVAGGVAAVVAVAVIASTCGGGGGGGRPAGPAAAGGELPDRPVRRDDGTVPGALDVPAADEEPFDPYAPQQFSAPPGLDARSAHEWRKVADEVHKGKLDHALARLREFEARHGESAESARLRRWLEHAQDAYERHE